MTSVDIRTWNTADKSEPARLEKSLLQYEDRSNTLMDKLELHLNSGSFYGHTIHNNFQKLSVES